MFLIREILILSLLIYHCLCHCKQKSEDYLVQIDTVHEYILETRVGITDGSLFVDEYLKRCSFIIIKGHPYMCAHKCAFSFDLRCFASRIRDTHYCEHCIRHEDLSRRNTSEILDRADVKVRLDVIPEFIDGKSYIDNMFYILDCTCKLA